MDQKITVFTPTYNRAYILGALYESLKKQTSQNFEWLIVDDGSTDETEQLVAQWILENKILIRYYWQENGGKQRAHNTGVQNCQTPLFLCIDSDDYLVDDGIELLQEKWRETEQNPKVAGIIALRGTGDGTPLWTTMPEGVAFAPQMQLYTKYRFRGDATLLYRTEILKKYMYWVADGEKFIGEGYVYNQIDQEYTLALMNKVITVCVYREDGYTNNVRKVTKENPISYTELKRQTILYSEGPYERFYHSILYIAGCIMSGEKHPISKAPRKLLAIMAYVPGWLAWFFIYRKA